MSIEQSNGHPISAPLSMKFKHFYYILHVKKIPLPLSIACFYGKEQKTKTGSLIKFTTYIQKGVIQA